MPTLIAPPELVRRLERALHRAGCLEIGGVLVGEHMGQGVFRLMDLSIQQAGGPDHFVRRPEAHQAFLDAFFESTGDDFRRFNYLGEWHSHPSYPARPSPIDRERMMEIVTDRLPLSPDFAMLLICRLSRSGAVRASSTAFHRDGRMMRVPIRRHDGRGRSTEAGV